MTKYLIETIRTCLRVPGKQEPAVNKLTDEQLFEVFNRLRKGQNPNEIGRYVQRAWGFMKDRSSHTVGQSIRLLQKRISHLILETPQAEIPPTGPLAVVTVSPKGLRGHQRLYDEMLDRTLKLLEEERTTGIPYRELAKDALAVSSLSKSLLKLKEFELTKIDPVEISKRQRQELEIKRRFDQMIAGSKDGGETLVKVGQEFLKLCEEDAVPLKENAVILNPISEEERNDIMIKALGGEGGTWKH